MLVVDKDT